MGKDHHFNNEKRTRVVVYLAIVTMLVEIVAGYITKSMALLADGWHMASHVLALGLSWLAYYLVRKNKNNENFRSGSNRILSLSGYSSALILLIISVIMAIESVRRFITPEDIRFSEAIVVAIAGLIVNVISAIILHTKSEHSDHNIRSAYIHVMADALTSLTAIVALVAGLLWNIASLDAISGIISSAVICKWAVDLMLATGKELLDFSKGKE